MDRTDQKIVVLPFPPTTGNHQHIQARNGKRFLRPDVVAWRGAVAHEVFSGNVSFLGYEPLKMELRAYMPDKRRRDLGNIEKLVSDALQLSSAILNDELLHEIHLYHCGVDRQNPRIEVTLCKK